MIRALTVAAFAASGFALPALAEATAKAPPAEVSAYAAELASSYAAKQVRQILAGQGYVNISALDRDGNGRWTGSAQKDGKTVYVAIVLPAHAAQSATN